MERKVVISKTAARKLDELFDYLLENWSEKVKKEFIEKLDYTIGLIQKQPEIFPESQKKRHLRRCVITEQTTLYYRFNSKRINIVTLFDTRQDPEKLDMDI